MSGRIPDHYVRYPVNFQNWEALTFLHWPYDPATVQALIPEELTVQQWDGVTWVGITPFRMTTVRIPFLPTIPGWRAFPELNVRVYVRHKDGRNGIWFLGMVVPRLSFVAAAGSLGLPYRRSHSTVSVEGSEWEYPFGTPDRLHPHPDLSRTVAAACRDRHGQAHRAPELDWPASTNPGADRARCSYCAYPADYLSSGLGVFEQFRDEGRDPATFGPGESDMSEQWVALEDFHHCRAVTRRLKIPDWCNRCTK